MESVGVVQERRSGKDQNTVTGSQLVPAEAHLHAELRSYAVVKQDNVKADRSAVEAFVQAELGANGTFALDPRKWVMYHYLERSIKSKL